VFFRNRKKFRGHHASQLDPQLDLVRGAQELRGNADCLLAFDEAVLFKCRKLPVRVRHD